MRHIKEYRFSDMRLRTLVKLQFYEIENIIKYLEDILVQLKKQKEVN